MDSLTDIGPAHAATLARMGRDEALHLLAWQAELGADEAISDSPVDRYALAAPATPAPAKAPATAQPDEAAPAPGDPDPVAEATASANGAATLDALRSALDSFAHCGLRETASQLVFADGIPGAPLMIIGEAPGRDEDRQGKPFVGRAGQLLDRMLAEIGRSRDTDKPEDAVYITNVLPWRPPQNRTPSADEIAMMLPFLRRHIALAAPKVLLLMGNTPCQALLGRTGITRLRGHWHEVEGLPTLPSFHPAYLLRTNAAKRDAWADLLALRAQLGAPQQP